MKLNNLEQVNEGENEVDVVAGPSNVGNTDANTDKNWLRFHLEPFEEVKIKWQNTFNLRRKEILESPNANHLATLFEQWPGFKQSSGFILVSS